MYPYTHYSGSSSYSPRPRPPAPQPPCPRPYPPTSQAFPPLPPISRIICADSRVTAYLYRQALARRALLAQSCASQYASFYGCRDEEYESDPDMKHEENSHSRISMRGAKAKKEKAESELKRAREMLENVGARLKEMERKVKETMEKVEGAEERRDK